MRRVIEQWCIDRGRPLQRVARNYGGGPTMPSIADDADVTVIAAHCSRLVIDTLIGRAPSFFPHSVYLLGLASSWIFDAPFDTYPIDVGAPATPEQQPKLMEEAATEERRRTLQLLADYQHASSPGSDGPQTPSS